MNNATVQRSKLQRLWGWRATATLCALIVSAATAIPAQAAFPGANGKILFSSNRDGNDEIYVMKSDGSDRVDLTRNPASDTTPEWSPAGTQIAFASNRSGEYEIYLMNPDGSGVTQLTSVGFNTRPVFTADGQYIVFTSTRDGNSEIYRMRPDGSEQTNLTNNPEDDRLPASAPRGKLILFQSSRSGFARLYIMNENGGVPRQVPGGPLQELAANWSPQGNTLTFLGNNGGFSEFDIYTAHTDGTNLTRLTDTPSRIEFDPMWSPDGQQIAFEGCTDIGTDTQHCALYTMNADGTGETDISTPRIPYLDTFSADRIDPFWSSGTFNGTGPVISEANGLLQIDVPSSTANGPAGYATSDADSVCRLHGGFDIQTDYKLLLWPSLLPGVNGVNVNFGVNFTHTLFVHNSAGTTGVSTFFPGPVNAFAPFADTSGSLRLVSSGGNLTGYYRSGASWIALLTTPFTADESFVQLSIFTNDPPFSHPDIEVAFDNFRVNNGTFACPSWWTDNAHDWQPIPK